MIAAYTKNKKNTFLKDSRCVLLCGHSGRAKRTIKKCLKPLMIFIPLKMKTQKKEHTFI